MNYLLIILSALLLNTANYFPQLFFLSWLGFIPLFYVLDGGSRKKIQLPNRKNDLISKFISFFKRSRSGKNEHFFCGWLFGFFYISLSSLFLYHPIRLFTDLSIIITAVLLAALFAVLALFYGAFFKLYFLIFKKLNPFYFAAAWLIFSYLRYKILYFFPIGFLSTSQAEFLNFIQLAELGGPWLLIFLLVLTNAVIYLLIFKQQAVLKYSFILIIIVALIFGYGSYSLQKFAEGHYTFSDQNLLRVGLITTEISQDDKWDYQNIEQNVELTLEAADELQASRIIFAPESNITFNFDQSERRGEFLADTADRFEVPVQIGSLASELEIAGLAADDANEIGNYNSSFLLSAEGEILQRYNKNRLVYFGEFYPFQNFLNELTGGSFSSLKAGSEITTFRAQGLSWKTVICSEILYTDYLQRDLSEANFIVNQTNEGWFRNSRLLKNMMWNNAVLRAVESRKSVIKVGNQAYDGIIYPSGRYNKTEVDSNYHLIYLQLAERGSFYSAISSHWQQLISLLPFF